MAELKDRYAAALFDLSLESGMLDRHRSQAVFVRDILQDDQCQSFLLHPHIPSTAKKELMQTLFADNISHDLMSFLQLAVVKNREAQIVPALSVFIDRAESYSGKAVAKVVSAKELSMRQISALETTLSKKLDKSVEIQVKIEPALIGGFFIQVQEYFIDASVRTKLNNMKESLIREETPNDNKA